MIYIPYEDYYLCARVLDTPRLQEQCVAIMDGLNFLRQGFQVNGWDKFTMCDLAAYGLYTCAELRRREFFVVYEKRITTAWFRLRRAGKLRLRPVWDEALLESFRKLLVWEDPELYEDKFNMRYIPFKPEIQW